jgi:tRNA dimethylallyltransferase
MRKAIAVVGPTAVGKTKLGVELAQKFNGEIVSADSRQVYKYLDISTGKDKGDYKKIPYHLLDIAEPNEEFNVTDFQKEAFGAIKEIIKRKKLPIIVGGSPFYVYAITEGWKFPKIKKDLNLRQKLNKKTLAELRQMLWHIDPKAYKTIDIDNPRRLIRAIEVCILSGQEFEKSKPIAKPKYNFIFLGITFSNEELKNNIHKRLSERIKGGMIDEVKEIIALKKASHQNLERMGLEPRFISYHLRRKINKKELHELLLKNIYLFAKRQMTWFRKDKRIKWVENTEEAEKKVKRFLST